MTLNGCIRWICKYIYYVVVTSLRGRLVATIFSPIISQPLTNISSQMFNQHFQPTFPTNIFTQHFQHIFPTNFPTHFSNKFSIQIFQQIFHSIFQSIFPNNFWGKNLITNIVATNLPLRLLIEFRFIMQFVHSETGIYPSINRLLIHP